VSDVVNKKTAKFAIDALLEMLSRVGSLSGRRLDDDLPTAMPYN